MTPTSYPRLPKTATYSTFPRPLQGSGTWAPCSLAQSSSCSPWFERAGSANPLFFSIVRPRLANAAAVVVTFCFEIKHTHNSFGLAVLHTHNNFNLLLVLEHRAARGAGSSPAASPSWSACSAAPWISGSHRMPAKRFSSRLTRWLGRTGTSFRWLTRRRMGRTEVKEEVLSRRSLAEIGLRNLASRILLRSLPAETADAMARFFSF
mmetsp:Transcript_10053/g.34724  ORF Transcript_10053/g.34724 Transcript_10053/m.34724 type:complete len:207 (+) Transcript_10053:1095-1715(+)